MQDPPVENYKPQIINFKELNKWRNAQWSQVRSPSPNKYKIKFCLT